MTVLAHFICSESDIMVSTYHGIYLFHIPLFIFISEIFHNNRRIKDRMVKLSLIGIVYNIVPLIIDRMILNRNQPWYLIKATGVS